MNIFDELKDFIYNEDPDTVEWNFKRKWPDEVKKAIGDGNRGKVHSLEQNKRHSEFMKGREPWNKGLKGSGKGKGVKECVFRGKSFSSMTEAAEYFGVTVSAVSRSSKKG